MQCSSVCTASAYVAADRRSGRHPEWSGVEGSGEERRGDRRLIVFGKCVCSSGVVLSSSPVTTR